MIKMKKQLIVLNGFDYDYCEEMKLYRLLGLLDQTTGMFEGVEVVTDALETLEKTKEKVRSLDPMSAKVVTGVIGKKIDYSTLDMSNGTVSHTVLKPLENRSFYGHEQQEELFVGRISSWFKSASKMQSVEDFELKAALENIISCHQRNFLWRKLQANVMAKKEAPKVKALTD